MNDFTKNWTGISYLNFSPVIPAFCPPSGYLLHVEDNRLLPNYGSPSRLAEPKYQIERGGIYPSMLVRNSMNLYISLSWSADCGEASNC